MYSSKYCYTKYKMQKNIPCTKKEWNINPVGNLFWCMSNFTKITGNFAQSRSVAFDISSVAWYNFRSNQAFTLPKSNTKNYILFKFQHFLSRFWNNMKIHRYSNFQNKFNIKLGMNVHISHHEYFSHIIIYFLFFLILYRNVYCFFVWKPHSKCLCLHDYWYRPELSYF